VRKGEGKREDGGREGKGKKREKTEERQIREGEGRKTRPPIKISGCATARGSIHAVNENV